MGFRFEWIDSINGTCKVLIRRFEDDTGYIIDIDELITRFKDKADDAFQEEIEGIIEREEAKEEAF